jgi:hypothetical protein
LDPGPMPRRLGLLDSNSGAGGRMMHSDANQILHSDANQILHSDADRARSESVRRVLNGPKMVSEISFRPSVVVW